MPASGAALSDSFVRIPNQSQFVNTFFTLFFVLLICPITPAYFGMTSVQNRKQAGQMALVML